MSYHKKEPLLIKDQNYPKYSTCSLDLVCAA